MSNEQEPIYQPQWLQLHRITPETFLEGLRNELIPFGIVFEAAQTLPTNWLLTVDGERVYATLPDGAQHYSRAALNSCMAALIGHRENSKVRTAAQAEPVAPLGERLAKSIRVERCLDAEAFVALVELAESAGAGDVAVAIAAAADRWERRSHSLEQMCRAACRHAPTSELPIGPVMGDNKPGAATFTIGGMQWAGEAPHKLAIQRCELINRAGIEREPRPEWDCQQRSNPVALTIEEHPDPGEYAGTIDIDGQTVLYLNDAGDQSSTAAALCELAKRTAHALLRAAGVQEPLEAERRRAAALEAQLAELREQHQTATRDLWNHVEPGEGRRERIARRFEALWGAAPAVVPLGPNLDCYVVTDQQYSLPVAFSTANMLAGLDAAESQAIRMCGTQASLKRASAWQEFVRRTRRIIGPDHAQAIREATGLRIVDEENAQIGAEIYAPNLTIPIPGVEVLEGGKR